MIDRRHFMKMLGLATTSYFLAPMGGWEQSPNFVWYPGRSPVLHDINPRLKAQYSMAIMDILDGHRAILMPRGHCKIYPAFKVRWGK